MSKPHQPAADLELVGELFAEVLEASPEEHKNLLAAAAIDSPEVAAEVGSLLAFHADRGILDTKLDARKAGLLLESETMMPIPERIGPYRPARELGRGGMGVVFLAQRVEGGFEQRVALKLVKLGMDSEAILARFLHERQILARLEHPGIARLIDGGLTSNGQPYFAMEYVEAEPITDYCNRAELGFDDRLNLFGAVCEAVQYAHGRLVVHRDIKPSNVLVTPAGVVKLVDFGIAKVLDPTAQPEAVRGLTAQGASLLTPEYASPEQVRREAVTVTSDVYSLGVLLYELFAERSPYQTPLGTPEDVHREVCETEPLPPSAALRHESGSQDARRRRFAKRLRGDLDKVILKALAKKTDRRYQSVEALAEDIHRFRQGRPVRAHRAGWFFRTSKFIGRNRVGVAALVALVLGLAGTTWQAATAARERDRSQLETKKLVATQEYLVSLFRAADPAQAQGKELTAKDLVVQGIERLEEELSETPTLRLEMLEVLGRVSSQLGDYEQTEILFDRALELARTLPGEHVAEADLLFLLGRLHNARGEWTKAELALKESLSLLDQYQLENRPIELASTSALANSYKSQGNIIGAVDLNRRALELAQASFGKDSVEAAMHLNNLGNSLKRQGDFQGAESALLESLAIKLDKHGPEHPEVPTTMVNLGGVLFMKGDWQRAEQFYSEGVEKERRLRGDQHPRLAIKLHNLANCLNGLGRFDEAANLHREALESIRVAMGEQSPYYATTLDSLAADLAEGGHFSEAVTLLGQAHELLLQAVGTEHEFYLLNLRRQARAQHLQGLDQAALPLVDQALNVARQLDKATMLIPVLIEHGEIQYALGSFDEAQQDFDEALQLQRSAWSEEHPNVVSSQTGLGWTLISLGNPTEAAEVLGAATALARKLLPRDHWRRAEANAALGAALIQLGRSGEGHPILLEAHTQLSASRGPDHPATRRATGCIR